MVFETDIYIILVGHIMIELLVFIISNCFDLLMDPYYNEYSFNKFFSNVLSNYVLSIIIVSIVNIFELVRNKKYNGIDLTELDGDYSESDEDSILGMREQIFDLAIKYKPLPLPIKFRLYLEIINEIKNFSPLNTTPSLKLIKEAYEDTLNLYDIEGDYSDKFVTHKNKIIEGTTGYLHLYTKKN